MRCVIIFAFIVSMVTFGSSALMAQDEPDNIPAVEESTGGATFEINCLERVITRLENELALTESEVEREEIGNEIEVVQRVIERIQCMIEQEVSDDNEEDSTQPSQPDGDERYQRNIIERNKLQRDYEEIFLGD